MQQHAYEAKANHFKKPLYKFMKLHNTEIILYKLYPCNNRRELLYAEGQYIKKLIKQGHKLANKVMSPVRSIKPKSLSKTQKNKT